MQRINTQGSIARKACDEAGLRAGGTLFCGRLHFLRKGSPEAADLPNHRASGLRRLCSRACAISSATISPFSRNDVSADALAHDGMNALGHRRLLIHRAMQVGAVSPEQIDARQRRAQ
ncbi:MAG: hypothetical protein U1E81_20030 [Xanthobacteraceae bacterium]